MHRFLIGFILVFWVGGVAEADLNLAIRDEFIPAISADYPFVYPFTGTIETGNWRMICREGACGNQMQECGAGRTNFASIFHASCNHHHTGEDWLVNSRSDQTESRPIYSINHGVVVFASQHSAETGHLVIIKHLAPPGRPFQFPAYPYRSCGRPHGSGSFIYSYYLHLDDELLVAPGEQVFKGQVIGKTYTVSDVRQSPLEYDPHLHFELWSQVKAAPGDLYNDSDGYDDQDCGGPATFGYKLAKLLQPQAFIEANNAIPIIRSIEKTSQGDLVIHGSGFGPDGGNLQVLPCQGAAGLSIQFQPAATDWRDDQILFRRNLSAVNSTLTLQSLQSLLHLRVTTGAGGASNSKNFPFTDVTCKWYAEDVVDLWRQSLMTGKDQSKCVDPVAGGCSFAPEGSTTRAEFVVMLVRARDAACSDAQLCSLPIPYSDVPADAWYHQFVRAAFNRGWISNASVFRPSDKINRAEAVYMLSRAFGMQARSQECQGFADVESTAWYYEPICAMTSRGIVNGYRPGFRCEGTSASQPDARYFCPNKNISRAEAVAILSRALKAEAGQEGGN